MNIEEKVKSNLLTRGFDNKTLLNNRGLIGATIDETILEVVKNLRIADVSGSKPTGYEKNNLPLEVRYAYNEGVELHQKIVFYETGVINKDEFIKDITAIKNRYK